MIINRNVGENTASDRTFALETNRPTNSRRSIRSGNRLGYSLYIDIIDSNIQYRISSRARQRYYKIELQRRQDKKEKESEKEKKKKGQIYEERVIYIK